MARNQRIDLDAVWVRIHAQGAEALLMSGEAMRILALITLALITVSFFGDELLEPIGVPRIWFPFGIGISRTQYLYAIFIPLLAFLIVRTLGSHRPRPISP